MSARRLVILSVVVLLLFAFILLVERKVPSTEERQRQGELLWDLPEDRIEEIHLEHSGTQIRLKKSGDSWNIVQPETYPADSAAVSEVTSQLADLKRAEGEAAEARPEDYGLASPQAKATIFWTDEKAGSPRQQKTVEFGLEIPGTDVTAARLAGSAAIVFVPSSVAAAARKGLNDLKSREVFGGSALDVSRIEIGRGSGRLSLAKKGSAWWLEQPLADLASSETADELAGELTSLRVQEFVTGPERENLAALGLDPPLYRVSVTYAKGKPVVVELGSTRAQGNAVYGRRENQVFTVESSISEDLSREAVAFRSPQLVRFDRADVNVVTGTFGAEKHNLTQKDGGWTLGGKPVLASATDDVLTALLDLRSRGFLEGTTARPPEGSPPAGEIVLTLTSGERWDIRLFPRTGSVAALVGRRPGAFELAQDTVLRLEEAFRKAARAPAPTPVPAARPTAAKKLSAAGVRFANGGREV